MTSLRPLSGMRVVTTALNVPGPMAVERLRDLGATAIKVEPPSGDPLKTASPDWYAALTAGIQMEALDLKTAAGQARITELLGAADLLITAQRPAALARIGLAWDTVHPRFPSLCQVAIVGHRAPHAEMPGHDLTYLAAHHLVEPGSLPRTLFADAAGSERAVSAALAALFDRGRTGSGVYVEAALADAAERLAMPRAAGLTRARAMLGGGFPGYNLYRAKDGWIAVAALEPHFYERLRQQLGVSEPSYEAFQARFALETVADWERFARRHDLPIAVVTENNFGTNQ